jgi:beta-lactamase class A
MKIRLAVTALAAALSGCYRSPLPDHPPNPERERMLAILRRELNARLTAVPGAAGLVFKDIDTDEEVAFQPDRVFHAASVIKLFILVEAFQRAYEGTLALNAGGALAAEFPGAVDGRPFAVADCGALREKAGDAPSALRLCEEMIAVSSNCAANNLMLRLGGPAAVSQSAAARGAARTKVPRYIMDEKAHQAGVNPETTPADVASVLDRLARRMAVSPDSSREMVRILTTAEGGFLARLLPPAEIEIAHKPGAIAGVRHDAGFITCANGTYVLVVMMQDLQDEAAGEAAGAQISRMCYDYVQNRPR